MSTEIVNIAGKLVKRSQGLRERYRNELAKLDGPKRVTADAKLGFTSIILPLADIHSESERRKANRAISERRKARGKKAVAGSQPETDVGENSVGRITLVGENSAGRITLVGENSAGRIQSPAGRAPIDTQTLLSPSQLSSSSVSEAAAQDQNVDLENIDKELPGSEPVVETQRSIPYGSSASPPKEAEAESGAEPRLSEEVRMDKGKGREVDAGEAKEAEAALKTRKCKRAANEVEKSTVEKRRKYGLEIPIINLDVEEGVEELKHEALDEEEKDEALAVEEAVKVLFRGKGRPDKETAGRMLRKMMKVMKAEVVEVDDD
ncbi:hypothetical protein BGX38DRAFT_1142119 [Terfezia claveryi]|nr:hypothetical protein BGX38DRAFT_1142119 [Terfezia claveryi]